MEYMQTAGCRLMPVYLQLTIDKCDSIVYLALQPLRGVKAVSLQQSPSLIPGGLCATASEHHCCRLCTHPSLVFNIPGQGDLNNVADDNDPNPLFCRLYQILSVGSPA